MGSFLRGHLQCPACGDLSCKFRLSQSGDEIDGHCQYHGDVCDGSHTACTWSDAFLSVSTKKSIDFYLIFWWLKKKAVPLCYPMRVPLLSLPIIGVPLLTAPCKDVPLLIFFYFIQAVGLKFSVERLAFSVRARQPL